MKYKVLLTHDAESDLASIFDYIAEHDAVENALYVLDQIEQAVSSLSDLPERGNYPKELAVLGIRDYREIFSNLIGSSIASGVSASTFS